MESITRLTAGLVVFSMQVSFKERDGNWKISIDTILSSDLFPIAIGILTFGLFPIAIGILTSDF